MPLKLNTTIISIQVDGPDGRPIPGEPTWIASFRRCTPMKFVVATYVKSRRNGDELPSGAKLLGGTIDIEPNSSIDDVILHLPVHDGARQLRIRLPTCAPKLGGTSAEHGHGARQRASSSPPPFAPALKKLRISARYSSVVDSTSHGFHASTTKQMKEYTNLGQFSQKAYTIEMQTAPACGAKVTYKTMALHCFPSRPTSASAATLSVTVEGPGDGTKV